MTDQSVFADQSPAASIQRLSDRLASLAPPRAAAALVEAPATKQRYSPAVTAALANSYHKNSKAVRRAEQRLRSQTWLGRMVGAVVSATSFIPFALVALGLRVVIARVFFVAGQTLVDGPRIPINFHNFDFLLTLPMQVRPETFTLFMTNYAAIPLPATLTAYFVSYAEFVLPVLLVLGLGTRLAALGLLAITAAIQLFVLPGELWNTHVYWAAILLVLVTRGAGEFSLDHVLRWFSRR